MQVTVDICMEEFILNFVFEYSIRSSVNVCVSVKVASWISLWCIKYCGGQCPGGARNLPVSPGITTTRSWKCCQHSITSEGDLWIASCSDLS